MRSQKFFLITAACVIAFAVTPLIAAESIRITSAANQSLLLAEAREQHTSHKDKSDKKTVDEHAGHKKCDKMQSNYADMIASHSDVLDLTDEQLGKIIRLHQKSAKQNREIMQHARESMKAFHKASASLGNDDDTLRKHAKDHADAINKLAEERISQRKAMHDILTEEQLKKLKTMKMHHGSQNTDSKGEHSHH